MNTFYQGKKVLITGNSGFKGTWLTQILINFGAEVIGIALEPDTDNSIYEILGQQSKIRENILDVRDFESMRRVFEQEKPDMVFHLAAQPLVLEAYRQPRYTYEVNVMGTVNVCECVRMTDSVKSFINVTTDKVYRNNEWEFPYREEDDLDGYDPYSNSKSCSELVTASYIRAFFQDKETAVSTCRAGNVIGGGDFSLHRIIPDCYRDTIAGKEIEIRNPHSIRPYQHVLEAVFFYLLVARRQYEERRLSGVYNVGPEYTDAITTGKMAELFCRYWGEEASWKTTSYKGPHEANILRLDTSRAKSRFGWRPVWSVEKAVEETVKWYRLYEKNEDMVRVTDEQIRHYLNDAKKWWDE